MSGCPEGLLLGEKPGSQNFGTAKTAPAEAEGPEGEAEGEAAPAGDDVIWTDPIDWFTYRVFSRRFYKDGEEFTCDTVDGDPYVSTAKVLRRFEGKPLFKLFATNVNQREPNEPVNALIRILQKIFKVRHEDYDIAKLLVRLSSIAVKRESDGAWLTVEDFGEEGQEFDFVALHEGGILELGSFEIPAGLYTKMRLNLADGSKVVVDEGQGEVERPLRVPSAAHQRIELVHEFAVTAAGMTSVQVDFDLESSVRRTIFGLYRFTPVLRIIGVETGTPSSKLIRAAAGGVVEILDEIAVVIPAGALSADTQVTVRPAYVLSPHTTTDLLVIGQEYVVEPEGLTLQAPAEVVLAFRAEHADALGLDPSSLALGAKSGTVWSALAGGPLQGETKVHGQIAALGRIATVGRSSDEDMSQGGGCIGIAESVAVSPTELGVDPQLFYGACKQQSACYQHGGRTYGLSAAQCLDEMFQGTTARCERLCESAFGAGCGQLSEADKASELGAQLLLPLFNNCLVVAGRMFEAKTAAIATEYPPPESQTCVDYAGLGVSCATPTCTLAADRASIPIDTPTDLNFTLTYAGNIEKVDFDGSVIYDHAKPALPIEATVLVVEHGRSLSAAKTFVATVAGPADQAGECSVTVDVFEEPDPCTIVITPSVTPLGLLVNIFLTALPGYNQAFMDLRTAGTMNVIGLSASDATGNRYFSVNVRPGASRTYTARVVHDDGSDFFCSADVTVE